MTGWSKVVGCQGMNAPAPKCAAYVQRHDADLITPLSPTVPLTPSRGSMVTWCKAPAEATQLGCVRQRVTGPRSRSLPITL